MTEKKMTPEELVRWLDDNDVPYGIDDAGKLTVKGNLKERSRDWARTREYTSLPDELVHVDGNLWLEQTSIMSLGGLTSVRGDLDLGGTLITSLGNLTSVGRGLDLGGTLITSLDNLTYVGGYLDLRGTPITSLGNLTSVGGNLYLQDTPLNSLGNLTSVGWNLMLQGASIPSLDDLPQVGRDLLLDKTQFRFLTGEVLRKVAGKIKHKRPSRDLPIPLSPSELETIIAENEARDSLQSIKESVVDWDLYDR